MTRTQWEYFKDFRDRFRTRCEAWTEESRGAGGVEGLEALLAEAAKIDGVPEYPVETTIVYNRALDEVDEGSDIRLIVVGDNPGKNEQLAKNRRYLVGQAGKLGEGFFRSHPELGVDFRANAIILNKTPIHTAKTKELAWVRDRGGAVFERLFRETQAWMARETAGLAGALGAELWLVGYGELREKGLFGDYARELRECAGSLQGAVSLQCAGSGQATESSQCAGSGQATESLQCAGSLQPTESLQCAGLDVRLYQHFSMNRFSIDLKERYTPGESLAGTLERIGLEHRREILGW